MENKLWHQTIAAQGRLTLFPDEETVRTCVRALARVVEDRLLLFSLVDDHLHQLPAGNRVSVGNLACGTALALRSHVTPALAPTYTKVVETRAYLRHLVDYFLQQAPHHGLPAHPALWGGSCFLDLIGARVVPGLTLQLRQWLPRLRLRELYGAVGLPLEPIRPADDDMLRRLGAFRIAEAAAAALCVGPALTGNDRSSVTARAGTVALAEQSGISRREAAEALEITARAARRLLTRPVDQSVLRATRMRLSLEEAVAGSAFSKRRNRGPNRNG